MSANIEEIQEFLDSKDIEYIKKDQCFELKREGPKYKIQYVVARDFPINTPKYGIVGVSNNYFHNLSKKAEENNEFINWIYDYEWNDLHKKEVLKSYIQHAAGKTPYKWYARDCEVFIPDKEEGIDFERNNCFFGTRGASLRLMLRSKKEKNGFSAGTPLMVYSFGLNFFGKKKKIEVIRVGTLKNSQIVGGVSKILKHFIDNYKVLKVGQNQIKVDEIYYYLDYPHQNGSGVTKMGFDFVKSTPSFMNLWLEAGTNKTDIIKHRQPNKHKWVMEQTEKGLVLPIATAGTKTFVLNVEKWKKEKI